MAGQLEIGLHPAVRTDAPLASDPAMVVTLKPGGGAGADVNIAGWFGSVLPTVGQKVMASSIPVVIASNQSSIPVNVGRSSAATTDRVPTNTANVTLQAANASRVSVTVFNNSSANLFIKKGATASITAGLESFLVRIPPLQGYYIDDYTGIVDGIWDAADANGEALVTEC